MRLKAGLALALLSLCAAPALAQEPSEAEIDDAFDRGCGDDKGNDRCDAEMQQEMRALYGWKSASELIGQGVQFRRFMMVDGYGRDILGLSFERRPGASPRVIVQVPEAEYASEDRAAFLDTPLSGMLNEAQWKRSLELTEYFERDLVGEKASDDDSDVIVVCVHSWFTVMEAGDPALIGGKNAKAKLRFDVEDACTDGLAIKASFDLADAAFDVLPECHGLDIDNFRNRISLLAHCKQLGGDRLAAADAATLIDELERWQDGDDMKALSRLFDTDRNAQAIRFASLTKGHTLYWGAPFAHNQRNATVQGSLSRLASETENSSTYQYATVTAQLVDRGSVWRITSFEISDYTTHTETYDD